jgi:hypothetical protein
MSVPRYSLTLHFSIGFIYGFQMIHFETKNYYPKSIDFCNGEMFFLIPGRTWIFTRVCDQGLQKLA